MQWYVTLATNLCGFVQSRNSITARSFDPSWDPIRNSVRICKVLAIFYKQRGAAWCNNTECYYIEHLCKLFSDSPPALPDIYINVGYALKNLMGCTVHFCILEIILVSLRWREKLIVQFQVDVGLVCLYCNIQLPCFFLNNTGMLLISTNLQSSPRNSSHHHCILQQATAQIIICTSCKQHSPASVTTIHMICLTSKVCTIQFFWRQSIMDSV